MDVLAEISAHSLPLGKSAAHHAAPTIYEWGPNVELPEVSRQEIDDAYDQATDPITALKPPVAPDIRSASAKLTAGGELGGELGGAHPAVQQTVQHMLSPTGMLALQQKAMEKRLGRPMREDEARKMKAEARASAMASLSFLVGTACCMVAAAFAGSSCGASTASRARVSRSGRCKRRSPCSRRSARRGTRRPSVL